MFKLDDVSESEVAFDYLGLVFNNLIDTDYCQDNTGASQAVEEEVTISSNSETLPRQKPRLVTRKVRFSHPLAYLDPHFLLKKQQHESRRQARNNDDDEPLLFCNKLLESARMRFLLPLTFAFINESTSLLFLIVISLLQEVSRSSGDSSQTQLPAFKTAPG